MNRKILIVTILIFLFFLVIFLSTVIIFKNNSVKPYDYGVEKITPDALYKRLYSF